MVWDDFQFGIYIPRRSQRDVLEKTRHRKTVIEGGNSLYLHEYEGRKKQTVGRYITGFNPWFSQRKPGESSHFQTIMLADKPRFTPIGVQFYPSDSQKFKLSFWNALDDAIKLISVNLRRLSRACHDAKSIDFSPSPFFQDLELQTLS